MDALSSATSAASSPRISVRNLTVGYGSYVLMRDVSFDVARDDVFLIMGGSGCGKSTLLRVLMGLKEPQAGQVRYGETDFWACTPRERRQTRPPKYLFLFRHLPDDYAIHPSVRVILHLTLHDILVLNH